MAMNGMTTSQYHCQQFTAHNASIMKINSTLGYTSHAVQLTQVAQGPQTGTAQGSPLLSPCLCTVVCPWAALSAGIQKKKEKNLYIETNHEAKVTEHSTNNCKKKSFTYHVKMSPSPTSDRTNKQIILWG